MSEDRVIAWVTEVLTSGALVGTFWLGFWLIRKAHPWSVYARKQSGCLRYVASSVGVGMGILLCMLVVYEMFAKVMNTLADMGM